MKVGEIVADIHADTEKDYMNGMKYQEIADKYNVTINTVKSWKKRYAWERKKGAPKKEKVCTQNKEVQPIKNMYMDDGTKDTLQNDELTPEQQMFCIYYSRTFNATQSYQKAYGCSYSTALTKGPALIKDGRIRSEILRLKEIKAHSIIAGENDIVEMQMKIAFADIGNYLSFGRETIETKDGRVVEVNSVNLNESYKVDTQLIQEVKEGRDGVSIKLADRQKAIDWLSKYFLMHPSDKYKAEFDKRKAGESDAEFESDGFMDALKGQVKETFADSGEDIET